MVQIYAVVALITLMAVCSLAVDFGRVQLVKTEMRRLCDAAARYAVTGVSDGTALAKANWVAGQNAVDNAGLAFQPTDVEIGNWDKDTSVFVPNLLPMNAVRVTARRTAATNNAVETVLARAIGINTVDVTVRAIATMRGAGYAVVGLNYITMNGNSSDSYWSHGSGPTGEFGAIASNGNITLSGSSMIHGDARPGVGKMVFGATHVTGSTAPLTSPLSFPNGNAGTYATSNDNVNIPAVNKPGGSLTVPAGSAVTLPGGNYYASSVVIGGSLSFSGPATIYCYGSFSMYGSANTSGNQPGNLRVVMCPGPSGTAPGNVAIGSSAALFADIYAPQSNIVLSGTGDIYGSVLGMSVTMTGTSAIHYDLATDPNNGIVSLTQ
jgi:hypothetical protein